MAHNLLALLVGTELLAHDRDKQVDQNAGCANKGKPEEQNPVVPVTDQHVVPEAFDHRFANTHLLGAARVLRASPQIRVELADSADNDMTTGS